MLKPDWATLASELGPRLKANERLASYTTLRIGGPADLLVRADLREELIDFTNAAHAAGLPVFVLGNGSNILVSDKGIRGLVIENHADDVQMNQVGDKLIVAAESGALLPGLANRLSRLGWSGLEWAIGVPSTIGAAVVGNAGAHGSSISDSLLQIEVLDDEGTIKWVDKSDLDFAYRTSRLKETPDRWVVLSAQFELPPDDPAKCIARMNQYTEHRRRTQPTDPSVGSMFKNPAGDFAGRLLESAGMKGKHVGNIVVSPVHANFFVNQGGGTAREVLELVRIARRAVKATSGIDLELEIQLVGEWDNDQVELDEGL